MTEVSNKLPPDLERLIADGEASTQRRGEGSSAWPEPDMRLIEDDRAPAPDFDWEAVPPGCRELIKDMADDCGAPPDYLAAALIGTASAVLGNVRRASPWEGWVEQPHLWFALVGPPSSNKTIALAPLKLACTAIEREMESPFKTTMQDYERRKEAAAAASAQWKEVVRQAVKDNRTPPPPPDDSREPEKPIPPRVMIADASTEQIGAILAGNPRGLVLVRSELAGWLGQFDRYGGAGADRAFYLETYDGGSHVIDRVKFGGVPLRVPYASLAIIGNLQPDHLREVFDGIEDGLAARLIYVWPSPIPPRRPGKSSGAPRRVEMLRGAFAQLRQLDWGRDQNGDPIPAVLRLEDGALEVLDKVRKEIFEANQADSSGVIAGWRGKNNGRLLRLAIVFEMLQWAVAGGSEPTSISVKMMRRAADFIDYCTAMMEHALGGLSLTEPQRDAAKLARFIMAASPACERPPATIINERVIYQTKGFRRLRDPQHRKKVFDLLEKAGWLRRADGNTGGRRREDWNANPKLWEK